MMRYKAGLLPGFFMTWKELTSGSLRYRWHLDRSAEVSSRLPILCGFHPASELIPCNVFQLPFAYRRDVVLSPAGTEFVRSGLGVPGCHSSPKFAQDPVAPGCNSSHPTLLQPERPKPARRDT